MDIYYILSEEESNLLAAKNFTDFSSLSKHWIRTEAVHIDFFIKALWSVTVKHGAKWN